LATDRTNGAALRAEIAAVPAANESAFTPTPVRLLVLDEGAKRVIRDQETLKDDQLWLGDARDPQTDESFPVYLRITAPTPLVAELLCAVIARMLGLPAPEAFVVAVPPGVLTGSNAVANMLYVGTLDVGGSTFSQLLRADSVSASNILRKWEHLVPVTVLDEWLANPDRNWGNILYVANTLHIIDHAEAFGGRSRNLFDLADLAEDQLTNKLAVFLTDSNTAQRQSYLTKAKEWLTFTAGALDINVAIAIAQVTRWQTPEQEAELVQFITNRIKITHRLLCNRLGHPQLALTH
jgi:hypothetical protein